MIRVAVHVRGVVQGVGFRPFVHGAATARGLAGWIQNRSDGLGLEVEGPEAAVGELDRALAILRRHPSGAAAVRIGTVSAAAPTVTLRTRLGSRRLLDLLSGEQLPRIC